VIISGGGVEGLAAWVATAEPNSHERNTRLYWAACRAHEQSLPTDELLAAAISTGLSQSEATNTINSARTAPPRRSA
jgi:hypothetical protein